MNDIWDSIDLDFLVVSLRKAQQRRAHIDQALSERGVRYRLIDAIDGDDEVAVRSAYTLDDQTMPKILIERRRPISNRELACTLSHLSAIRWAIEMGLTRALICEDDVEFGDFGVEELQDILANVPTGAAYVQLCISPAETVNRLASYHLETGQSFARKMHDPPVRFAAQSLAGVPCHCTGAYLITATGMQNIRDKYFKGNQVVFPCDEQEFIRNAGLLSDRFIYQAASSDCAPGYAYCIPTLLMRDVDSFIHPDRLHERQEIRQTAVRVRSMIKG